MTVISKECQGSRLSEARPSGSTCYVGTTVLTRRLPTLCDHLSCPTSSKRSRFGLRIIFKLNPPCPNVSACAITLKPGSRASILAYSLSLISAKDLESFLRAVSNPSISTSSIRRSTLWGGGRLKATELAQSPADFDVYRGLPTGTAAARRVDGR